MFQFFRIGQFNHDDLLDQPQIPLLGAGANVADNELLSPVNQQRPAQNPAARLQAARRKRRVGIKYKKNTVTVNEAVIRLYYGSLQPTDHDLNHPRMSVPALAKRARLPATTVYNIVRRFVQRGFVISDRRSFNGAKGVDLPRDAVQYIISQENLQHQAHLSLERRALQLNALFETQIWNKQRLFRVYKKHDIRFLKPQLTFAGEYEQKHRDLPQKRLEFGHKLHEIMLRDYKNIIFFDESSFHNWLHFEKSWMQPTKRINVVLPKQRIGGVTVFGAIGDALKKPVFSYADSTNIDNFTNFIPKLVAQLTDQAKLIKPYLVLDNHRAHVSLRVKPLLDEHFNCLFFPPFSPQFNSIESLWGWIKPKFRLALVENEDVNSKLGLQNLLEATISQLSDQDMQRFQTANMRYLRNLVQEPLPEPARPDQDDAQPAQDDVLPAQEDAQPVQGGQNL